MLLASAIVLLPGLWTARGTESNLPPLVVTQVETTNFQQLVRTCLEIQEQVQATKLLVEQNRQDVKAAAAQNAEALSKGLLEVQQAFSAVQAQEFETRQRASQNMLLVAGTFAAIGLLAMLIMIYFQWRTNSSLASIPAALSLSRGFDPTAQAAALAQGGGQTAQHNPVESSRLHLLGALDQLDGRIHAFKQALSARGNGAGAGASGDSSTAARSGLHEGAEHTRITALLNKAHSLMDLEDAEAAIGCFDEVLALDPNHTEALVKKGAALERRHRLNEAIECYDRAIAVDGSMTTAYLHKGGLCNRLERFKEALECYEKALHTQVQRAR